MKRISIFLNILALIMTLFNIVSCIYQHKLDEALIWTNVFMWCFMCLGNQLFNEHS
jgi:hypothetical protein